MSDAITCPHCLLLVLPTNGICPSCAQDVDDAGLILQSGRRRELEDLVEGMKTASLSDEAVIAHATSVGFPADLCNDVLLRRRQQVMGRRFELARVYLWPGYLAFTLGLVATVVSHVLAWNAGGLALTFHGAMLYGVVSILSGRILLRRHPL